MAVLQKLAFLALWFTSTQAQTCLNFGASNGSSCLCPPGFGGADCSSTACGGNLFQGTSRTTLASSPEGNLTASGCSCQTGWTGTGCNVCQAASACQNAASPFTSAISSAGALTGLDVGQNDTLICNTASNVWAAGEMSCSVVVSFDIQYCITPITHSPFGDRTLHYKPYTREHPHSTSSALTTPH